MSPNISMDRVFPSEGKDRSSILLSDAIYDSKKEFIKLNSFFIFKIINVTKTQNQKCINYIYPLKS